MNWVYMLRCGDGSLYTGWTNDLERRLRAHQAGRGGKYTRSRLPVELVWREAQADRRTAMHREWELKQLTRAQKLALLEEKEARDAAYSQGSDRGGGTGGL